MSSNYNLARWAEEMWDEMVAEEENRELNKALDEFIYEGVGRSLEESDCDKDI